MLTLHVAARAQKPDVTPVDLVTPESPLFVINLCFINNEQMLFIQDLIFFFIMFSYCRNSLSTKIC